MKLKPITEQVVVVMGAATGIGRLAALEFARRGARVVVSARDPEGLETLVAEIRQAHGEAVALPADISVADQVQAVADGTEQAFGRIDTWVNVAAVTLYAPFEQTTAEEWERVVGVDLLGYAHGMRAALPALRRQGGGAIINVSSIEGRVALPFQSAYAAAKHGVIGMTDALRLELRHEGVPVSVTNILPATTDTPLHDHARSKIGVKPRGLPPVYPPEHAVGAILYAAEHPVRELVVGGAGRALLGLKRLSPSLTDSVLALIGHRLQKTNEPRDPDAPDTLMDPQPDDRIKGEILAKLRPVRIPGWLTRHPRTRTLAALALMLVAFRAFKAAAAG
jgi:NAD(P)-dependent dehydrogenase (short-subunit alcohol dehydrogenase family)